MIIEQKSVLQAGSAGFSACFVFGSGICRLLSGRKKQEQKRAGSSLKRSLPCFKTEFPDQF
jgi:hypothetical protein